MPISLQVITSLRAALTYFSHSNSATTKLDEARKALNIPRGLQKIGNTRFATICISAIAMKHCLPALRQICTQRLVTLGDVSNPSYVFTSCRH